MTATIDSTFVEQRMKQLPPQSRKRAGYCDLLRILRNEELQHERMARDLERALDEELGRDPQFWQHAGLM